MFHDRARHVGVGEDGVVQIQGADTFKCSNGQGALYIHYHPAVGLIGQINAIAERLLHKLNGFSFRVIENQEPLVGL